MSDAPTAPTSERECDCPLKLRFCRCPPHQPARGAEPPPGDPHKVRINVEDVIGNREFPDDLVVSVKLGDLRKALRSSSPSAPAKTPSQQAIEDLAWILQTTPDLVVQGDGLVVAKAILERYPFKARGDLTK